MDPISIALMGGSALASIFGASKSADAAKNAAATQAAASDRASQMQYQVLQQQRQDQEPWRQTGVSALNQLNTRFSLPQVSGAAPAADQLTAAYGGGGSLNAPQFGAAEAYLAAHPDVAAEYSRLSPNNLKNNLGVSTPQEFAAWHYNAYGKGAGYDWGAQPAQSDVIDMQPAPSADGKPTYAYDPTAPGGYDVSAESYQKSPGYDYRVSEGLKAVNAGASAAGRLVSGQRLKALQDRGDNIADQDYTDWRNYTANRYDVNTGNLMSLAGLGSSANSANSAAASNYAAAYGQAQTGAAQAQANGQINSANAWSNGLNNIGTTAAYLYGQGAFGGGGSGGGGSGRPGGAPITGSWNPVDWS